MCLKPNLIPSGHFVACRECQQCKDHYVLDWVGRCTAESKTASRTVCMTLTYGPDDEGKKIHARSESLHLGDFQKFMKRMRNPRQEDGSKLPGYNVRYFCVGEYGKEKGRAHWHVILFFDGKSPNYPKPDEHGRIWIDEWPHGHVNLDNMVNTFKAVRYAVKYLRKEDNIARMTMSTKPALGTEYFRKRAKRMVRQGIAPKDLIYTFSEHRTQSGKLRQYYMHRGAGDKFIATWLHYWAQMRPGEQQPWSPLVNSYLDKHEEISFDYGAMEDWIEQRNLAQADYKTRLEAQRAARYAEEERREADEQKAQKQAEERKRQEPINSKQKHSSDWADQAARRRKRSNLVNTRTPGYDESKSLYTMDSAGKASLVRNRP